MTIKKFRVGVMSNNCYLVYNSDNPSAVLIDCGKGYERINDFCKENGLEVKSVLLTHGHFDHIADAAKWQRAGAKICIHSLDADKLYTDKHLGVNMGVKVEPCHADVELTDGQKYEEGGLQFKVMLTSGHTAGSVCFLLENYIFSGDTLFRNCFGRTDFPDGSFADMVESCKKLFSLDGDYTVLPGHDEPTTLEYERKYNEIGIYAK